MKAHDVFWKLDALSDRQLLDRLSSVLGSSRRLLAELIAHLGEVEERRLHLVAACSSMFAYCLKLGMTEDEAYRRIEVARLARRYSAIFPLLANGRLSLSVVALLKHHLSDENHLELLASAVGKTVGQTRELIAARFPRPDVPSSVRKLPEPRTTSQPSLALSTPTKSRATELESPIISRVKGSTEALASPAAADIARLPTHSQSVAPPRVSSRIEPLSAQRYKVQLTASAELVRKLELARDLMRHAHPDGELGSIIEQALDLLIESLMQRRFGKKASSKRTSQRVRHGHLEQSTASTPDTAEPGSTPAPTEPTPTALETEEPTASTPATIEPTPTALETEDPAASTPAPTDPTPRAPDTEHPPTPLPSAHIQSDHPGEPKRVPTTSYLPRSARRAVMERDGLSCSWVSENGTRCGSRSWLEYDHREPRARGGGSEPDNLRLLCRHHNRLAAERAYGRKHVEQSIAERRRSQAPTIAERRQ